MDPLSVAVILGTSFILLLCCGVPVPFALGVLNTAGVVFYMGGTKGLSLLVTSSYDSVSSFAYIAVPLFVLTGTILLHSGLAHKSISATDALIGRLPGRLCSVATMAGAIFGAVSGSSMASVATIGTVLLPEMEKKGYARWLSIGSVCCAGVIDALIPPSALAVIFAGIAGLPVGKLLMAGVIPGIVMAFCLIGFITAVALLKPDVAPRETVKFNLHKALVSLKDLVPLVALILLVVGGIFLGVVTPSEAAALGAVAAFFLAGLYRKLTFDVVKKALIETTTISGMALFIVASSKGFSSILAFTGVGRLISHGVVGFTGGSPLAAMIIMNLIILLMGCFMDGVCIMLITVPIFLPIAKALGMDLIWWALVMLLSVEIGLLTPPFGLNLFVAKGILGEKAKMEDVYRGIAPFIAVDIFVLVLLIVFPGLVKWLPGLMS
jgi:tripartite ATP-independent transporter DctM subunit